jgi:anti-sigma regulatory factor (Ser/Thr protein kinase)
MSGGPDVLRPAGEAAAEGGACDPRRVHSSLSGSLFLRLQDMSQVGGARRAVTLLARRLGLGDAAVGTAALAVTEVAKNLLQHAGGGELALWWSPAGPDAPVLEVVAMDRGPGMRDVARCFTDGYSTAGTPGTGLGAVRRAAHELDVYAPPGGGTVIWFRLGQKRRRGSRGDGFEIGTVVAPLEGEVALGDAWAVAEHSGGLVSAVCDGLGHGPVAAEAAREAVRYFCDHPFEDPGELIHGMHRSLGATRGAVAGVARLDAEGRRVRFAGVGNVAAVVEAPGGGRRHLVSHHGTLGHAVCQVQVFEAELEAGSLLVLHSDGLNTRWKLADYPGLAVRHPGVVAGVLHRDFHRGRDDAAVLVVGRRRQREEPWGAR